MITPSQDPHALSRFVEAQEGIYEVALEELRAGQKRTHWMWFIFPQAAGLGTSVMAKRYAIRSRAEAQAYLAHPLLGTRLLNCTIALLGVAGRSAHQIMGDPDCLKLKSSMTLFANVSPAASCFDLLLKYYGASSDARA